MNETVYEIDFTVYSILTECYRSDRLYREDLESAQATIKHLQDKYSDNLIKLSLITRQTIVNKFTYKE